MADTNIDKLSIDIDYSANTANAGLAKLKSALQELNTIVAPATQNLGAISRKLNSFGKATQQLNSANLLRFSTGLKAISNSVVPLTQLGKTNLGSFINQLKKIPDLNKVLDEKSIEEFTVKIQKLSNAMIPLATNLTKVGSVLSSMPSKLNKISSQSSKVNGTVSALSGLSKALNFGVAIALSRRASQFLGEFITQSNKYVEDLNLFNVAMGESTEKAKEFIDTVSDKLGLDPANMMRYMGVFQMIANGFGLGAENAYKMSKNLTQLTYDISSFYNIDIDEAAQKVQSAISGELEPVRRLGYALDQATLKQIALNNGIEKSFTDMTQAEKAQLRYIALLTQNVQVQGDMGRTIMSSANAIRVIRQQFQLLGREIGNIFIPALMKIIPVAIAVVRVLSKVAKAIASMLGFQLPDLNWESVNAGAGAVEDLEEDLDDATGAAKKLKRQLAGFDELNNLTSPTQGGGSGANTDVGAGFELDLPEYDMLAGYTKGIDDMTDKILKMFGLSEDELGKLSWKWEDVDGKIKAVIITLGTLFAIKGIAKIATIVGELGTAFGVIKSGAKAFVGLFKSYDIVDEFGMPIEHVAGGFEKIANALGLTSASLLVIIGAVALEVGVFINAYKNNEKFKQSVDNLVSAFKELWDTLQPIIEKLKPILEDIFENVKSGASIVWSIIQQILELNLKNQIDALTTALEVITALLNGDLSGAFEALKKGLGTIKDNWVDNFKVMKENAEKAIEKIGEIFGNVFNGIKDIFVGLAKWFYDTVIEPIIDYFKSLWEKVSSYVSLAWNFIVGIFSVAANWFNEKVIQPILSVFVPLITKIGEIFGKIWEIISTLFGIAANWFNETFIQPTINFFVDLYNKAVSIATGIWDTITGTLKGLALWVYNTLIVPVVDYLNNIFSTAFAVASGIWNIVTSILGGIANWVNDHVVQPISNFLTKAWEAVGGTISGIITGAINGVISGIENTVNWVINRLNDFLYIINKIPGVYIDYISPLYLPRFAKGGFPETGQFFMARESGPELVGQIGNRTAVANNDQIIAGIQQGVYSAMVEAQGSNSGSQNIYIGNRKVYSSFSSGLRTENNRLGKAVVSV